MTRVSPHSALFGLLALLVGAGPIATAACAADLHGLAASEAADPTRVAPFEAAEGAPTAEQPAPTVVAEPAAPTGTSALPTPLTPEIDYPNTLINLPGGSRVIPERFYSTTLGQSTWYEVVLPPGYAVDKQRYPVLYMLHGAMGGAAEWLEIGIHQAADQLWTEGAIAPFIIVLPDGSNSYYLNHASGGPRWGDYIAGDVVRQIDANYRTLPDPAHRAIGGLSMGGDGALQLALHHPDVFGIVGAHSPTTRLTYDQLPGPFYGDEDYWHQNSPLWLIENTDAAARLRIWIDDGQDDPWLPSAQALHEALLDRGVEHEYAELEGTHEAEYWEAYQADYLRFYGSAFAASPVAAGSAIRTEQ